MAISSEGSGVDTTMLVGPTGAIPYGYSGNNGGLGNGNDWLVLFILLLCCGNGWGNGFGGGNAAMGMMDATLPYFYNTQTQNDVNRGFDNVGLQSQLSGIHNAVTSGFGDTAIGIAGVNQTICQTGNGITAAVNNGFAQAEVANNARQIANMQQSFANQTAMNQGFTNLASQFADCCCESRLSSCQTQNLVQNEGNATRFADANNTRDIIQSISSGNQAILDKLCQLELDGVKAQVEAKNDRISELQTQLNMANLAASQTRQNAEIQNNLLSELRSCPIPSQPVYGSQPIFSCPNNNYGYGCGCNG